MTTEGIIKRFWTFVEKTGGCWNWKGSKTTTGYGNFRYGHDERIKAHRYVFSLYREISNGIYFTSLRQSVVCKSKTSL